MSWSTLGAFDWPTNNDVLDAIANSVFTLKAGQSVPSNNDWITIAEANNKLNIASISGLSTDWPTKSQFESSVIYYRVSIVYQSYGEDASAAKACALDTDTNTYLWTLRSDFKPLVGDYLYSWDGVDTYTKYIPYGPTWLSVKEGGVQKYLTIQAGTGLILEKEDCSSLITYYKFASGYSLHQYQINDYSCFLANTNFYDLYTTNPIGPSIGDIIYVDVEGIEPLYLDAWCVMYIDASLSYVDLITLEHKWLHLRADWQDTRVINLGNCAPPPTSIVIKNQILTSATNRISQLPSDGTTIALHFENDIIFYSIHTVLLATDWVISSEPINIENYGKLTYLEIYWHDTGISPWPGLKFNVYKNDIYITGKITNSYSTSGHPKHSTSLFISPYLEFSSGDSITITIGG